VRPTTGLTPPPAPLLGRDRELALIRELCARAASGQGGGLLIEGPAGIGKTSLLHAARELGDDAGLELAGARGGELEREFAYGVIRQLANPIVRRQTPAGRAELLGGAAGLAAPALGLTSDEMSGMNPSGEQVESEQGATLHGLYWFFANLAERAPLLVGVDDAHWADMLSLRFLVYLIRRLDDLPVAVLLTARAGEPGETSSILEQLSDEPACTTVRLAPIGGEEAAALVQVAFDTAVEQPFSEAVQRVAGGNPFLVRELVLAVKAEGIEPRGDQADRVYELGPESVARAVRRRIERLGAEALAFAQAVAIVGSDAELITAAALAELEPVVAARWAAELERIEVLVSEEDRVSFRHPILRTALYESIPSAQRGQQHSRAARLLADRRLSEAAAAQLLRTPARGEQWVVEALRQAARAAIDAGAPDTAAAYLERALDEPPDVSSRPQVLRELGLAEAAAGSPHAARHLREAIDGLPDPLARAATARDLARALAEELRLGEAAAVLVDAIEQLGDRDRELWLLMESDLHDAARRDLGSRHLSERLARIVPALGGETYAERIASAQWNSAAMLGQARTAADAASLAEQVATSVLELKLELPGPGSLIHTLIAADRLDRAESLIEQILERARTRGLTGILARSLGLRAHLARARGSVTDAETDGRLAVELCTAQDARPPAMIPAALVPALLERGKMVEAQEVLEQAGLERTLPDAMNFNLALFARARLRLEQGRVGEAIDDLHQVGARYEQWGISRPIPPWRSLLARAYWARGDEREARTWGERELATASEWGTPRAVGVARVTLGLVAGGAAGIAHLQQAAAALEDSPARLELAHALVELGAALRRANQRAAAREPLGRGMTLAAKCGADALAERAREELRATGARPRRLMLSGSEALTPSERRVAELAAAGQTNKQLAQAVFVSTRTVETHVRHALQKLNITSREQLAQHLDATVDSSASG
jgi:DNA-binding CsgD family transcriptional regulator/tetratricopeptide (TPR) repeat protein